MPGLTFKPRELDDEYLKELLEAPDPVVAASTAAPIATMVTERMEKVLFTLEVIGTMGLYVTMTLFTSRLIGSQGTGFMKWVLTALGGIFELTKVSFIIEGVLRKNPAVLVIAALFMAMSFAGAGLNMLSSWTATAEAAATDPSEAARASTKADLASLRVQLAVETARMEVGSKEYRTDAEQTRASIGKIREEIKAYEARLLALPAAKASEVQAGRGYFDAIPGTPELKKSLELWFRIALAALLEVGGFTGVVLLSRKRRKT